MRIPRERAEELIAAGRLVLPDGVTLDQVYDDQPRASFHQPRIGPMEPTPNDPKLSTNKYGAEKIRADGHVFDSRLEYLVYEILKRSAAAGQFSIAEVHPRIRMTAAAIIAAPDFLLRMPNGDPVYVEAKGKELERYRVIRQLWKIYGPAPLLVYKRSRTTKRVELYETITPAPVCHTCAAPRLKESPPTKRGSKHGNSKTAGV